MKKLYSLFALLCAALSLDAQTSGSQSFTSSGTFTVPVGVTSLTIEVVGAGGDGGGNGGGGGGGGGYAAGTYTITPSSVLPVIVGTGGNGPVTGTSSVSTFLSASGGDNGVSVSNPNVGGGGAGGVGSNGNIVNYTGGDGGGGYWTYFGGGGAGAAGPAGNGSNGGNTIIWTGQCVTPGGAAGMSGGAPGGAGGKGAGFTDANCNVTDSAANGMNYGGGGGGGNGNSGPARSGAGGYCNITWGATAIEKANAITAVTVFPNPFVDRINLQPTNGTETYELLNSIGQVVWAGMNISQQDFSSLPADLYLLKVQREDHVQTIRLLKN